MVSIFKEIRSSITLETFSIDLSSIEGYTPKLVYIQSFSSIFLLLGLFSITYAEVSSIAISPYIVPAIFGTLYLTMSVLIPVFERNYTRSVKEKRNMSNLLLSSVVVLFVATSLSASYLIPFVQSMSTSSFLIVEAIYALSMGFFACSTFYNMGIIWETDITEAVIPSVIMGLITILIYVVINYGLISNVI